MLKQIFMSERNMMIAIVVNAIVIFLLYFPQIESGEPGFFKTLDVIDHIFIIIFLLEAIIKISVLKPKNYFADSWNVFDFIIVIVSLPSFLNFLPVFSFIHTSAFKLLRLLRLTRLLRFLRFIPRMDSIVLGLVRALKASVFVFIALVFLNLLLALFTCHFYGKLVPEYFGDPLISSYYIFQMFTIEGWNEIPTVIAEAAQNQGVAHYSIIAGATRLYFIIVVLTGGIFGMSLANAIFVDEMTSDNTLLVEEKMDMLQKQVAELKQILEDQNKNS
jgi:voltage-gated sodium channel